MGTYRSWLGFVRRKFAKPSSQKTIFVLHTNTTTENLKEQDVEEEEKEEEEEGREEIINFTQVVKKKDFSEEDIAAIKIQTTFRGHLARRAFRALRSLVKLQAVVRGVCVRRQTRIALHCMHALVRLQVRVRARQLLNG